MKKLSQIFLGWYFWITNRNDYMAERRLMTCVPCSWRKGFLCARCGCVLQAKARLPEETCPINKWPGDNIDPQIRKEAYAAGGNL